MMEMTLNERRQDFVLLNKLQQSIIKLQDESPVSSEVSYY